MENIIVVAIIVIIVFLAVFYIYRSKKKGKKCIGCPYSDTCSATEKTNCSSCKK